MVYYMHKIKQGGEQEGPGMCWTGRQRKKWWLSKDQEPE